MTDGLPSAYLTYPKRAYGQDQDRYDWSFKRDMRATENDVKASAFIVVPLERFILNPEGSPFRAPGAMITQYPDLRHFTSRDYGNRIGAFRILKVLRTLGIKATFAVNARLLDNIKPLIERVLEDGHEIAAYGLDMDCIHWSGLDVEEETRWIEETRQLFDRADLQPRTWMSPARQQSDHTLDLIAQHGFDICLDWEFDCAPAPMRTQNGTVTMVPNLNELDDRKILIEKRHAEDQWRKQVVEAAAYSSSIASIENPQCFGITLTPYVSGLPFRVKVMEGMLRELSDQTTINTAQTIAALAAGRSTK